ncbi:hypothetical protein Tco_1212971 [Tanacetum coccineum]
MDFDVTNASTQQNPEQMDEEFTTTAYPSVQENLKLPTDDQVILEEPASFARTLSSLQNLDKELSFTNQFLVEKSQEDKPDKSNTEEEVQSMVTVPIHQDTSLVPLMTTPVIDLTMSQPVSTMLEQHMADLIQSNLALEERLDKHGSRLYKLENLNIPHQVKKAVDEVVTDAVDWAMQAPLRARFSDLPTVDMKEILHQRMFEDNSYEAHEVHANLFDALEKSLERDHSDQLLSDLDEARRKKRKRRASPRTPPGSPPSQPPPPPPPAGASGAPGTSGASGSTQLPPPPPPPPTGASGSAPQQGSKAPSSSMAMASTLESMAWTTSDTRYESTGVSADQDSSPTESLMHDDSTPDEQVQSSDDEDTGNDQKPEADTRKDWWKPLPEEERPATPEPAWTILPSNVSDVENNWASALASSYEPPAENSLLAKTGDMTTFLNWYCRQINKSKLTQADLEGQAYEVVKVFYPDIIHLQFHMEECHKMLTDQVDWANPEGDQVRINVNRPLPLGGPPGHVTIQTKFFFNKDLEYLRYGNKGSCPALSISKMKAASYPDFGLELLVPEPMWIDDVCTYDDFKNLYPSDFEDLNLLLLQGHLDHLSGSDKRMLSTAVKLWTRYEFKHDYTIIESPRAVIFPIKNNERKIMMFNEIYKFSDGTLTRILETLYYRVKEFKIKRLNPGFIRELNDIVIPSKSFRNSDEYNHDPEKCEHVGLKVTTSYGGNNTTKMIWRFTMADDLKECSKITQVKGTMLKDYYSMYKVINA